MQELTAPPRDAYTADQITALITAPDIAIQQGVDLLDSSDLFVADLSSYLQGGTVSRDCYATVHGSCSLSLTKQLNWGSDRVLPWMIMTSPHVPGVAARFNQGVFIATSPDHPYGDSDPLYAVTGYDKLYLLDQPVGDSVMFGAGNNVLSTVAQLINIYAFTDKITLDGTSSGAVLASDMIWPLDQANPVTYLNIINALLATINYRGLWVDQDGYFRSEPYIDPGSQSPEWLLNVQDAKTNLVNQDRVQTQDTWGVPNWWRFIQNGLDIAPVEGTGQYTYVNTSVGPTSYANRGYYVKKLEFLDAVDQANLQAQATATINADTNVAETWQFNTGPLPLAGHFDIATYLDTDIDGGLTNRQLMGMNWDMPLDGGDMLWTFKTVAVLSA